MSDVKIRLTKRITADYSIFKDEVVIVAEEGVYDASSNPHGAISIIINGKRLGVKPSEFEFIEAPAWVLEKHGLLADLIGRNLTISEILNLRDKRQNK